MAIFRETKRDVVTLTMNAGVVVFNFDIVNKVHTHIQTHTNSLSHKHTRIPVPLTLIAKFLAPYKNKCHYIAEH